MPDWMGRGGEWRREVATAAALGLFLGIIGPFGSFLNGDLALRVAYWTAMTVFGVVFYGLGLRWMLHQARRLGQPDWFVVPIAIAVLAGPMSVIVAFSVIGLWPTVTRYVRPFDWYAQVLVISLPINILLLWAKRFNVAADTGRANAPNVQSGAVDVHILREGLSAKLTQKLICLQMEDHYVRIHSEGGSELVLSSFKDAIDAVRPLGGLKVHRSWWVARDAVVRPIWSGQKVELELTNGIRAPVSRASVAKLRAAGWLDAESGGLSSAIS
jgi:hypothetical protein